MKLNEQVKQAIVERLRLNVKPEEIEDDAPLFGDGLGLDSIDALELAVTVEKQFGVEIKDEEEGQQAFQSIRTLVEFIHERRGPGAGG